MWHILDRSFARKLAAEFQAALTNSSQLTAEISLTGTFEIRLKHVLALLTVLRWFDIYFGEGDRHMVGSPHVD